MILNPSTRRIGSVLSIATLLAVFPANVHMAINAEDFKARPGRGPRCGRDSPSRRCSSPGPRRPASGTKSADQGRRARRPGGAGDLRPARAATSAAGRPRRPSTTTDRDRRSRDDRDRRRRRRRPGSPRRRPTGIADILAAIEAGGELPYDQDGTTFQNREGLLPAREQGYYTRVHVRDARLRRPRRPAAGDRRGRRDLVHARPLRLVHPDRPGGVLPVSADARTLDRPAGRRRLRQRPLRRRTRPTARPSRRPGIRVAEIDGAATSAASRT